MMLVVKLVVRDRQRLVARDRQRPMVRMDRCWW
jgi:hypothetical protein